MTQTETVFCAGVPRRPWQSKVNPLWWFGNDEEPVPPDWYIPDDRLRLVKWYLRNPLQNMGRYVIGVCDRPHWVTSPTPAMTNLWIDLTPPPQLGWKWAVTRTQLGLRLPYISYSGGLITFYAGWQPAGFFGIKFNLELPFQLW